MNSYRCDTRSLFRRNLLLGLALAVSCGAQTFSSAGSAITTGSQTTLNTSTTAVSGLTGTLTSVTLTLNFTGTGSGTLNSVAIALRAPNSGPALDVLSDMCNGNPSSFSFTLADSATALLPATTCPGTFSASYKPTDYLPGQDVFGSPNLSYSSAGNGTAGTQNHTFASTFGSLPIASINGTWTLYVEDQAGNGSGSLSWSLTFVVTGSNAPTTTTLNAGSPNPSFTAGAGSSVSFNAHVEKADNSGPATNGSVTLTDATTAQTLTTGSINSSGDVVLSATLATEGIHSITATFTGGTGFAASPTSAAVSQTVNMHATQNGNSFCNTGGITIGPGGPSTGGGAAPYPSNMVLGNGEPTLTGTISGLSVTLNTFKIEDPQEVGFILVSPDGTKAYEFMSETGNDISTVGSPINLTLADAPAASVAVPNSGGSAPASGTYLPTSDVNHPSNAADPYPLPAPQAFDSAAPFGSTTFLQDFGGLGVTGTWKLYASNRGLTGSGGSVGNWCLNFAVQASAHPTKTTVMSSKNPALTGTSPDSVTITATVAVTDTSGLTVGAGTVTFTDGSSVLATMSVTSGTASFSTNTLTEGTHHIVASYSGANSPNVFGVSTGILDQRIDHTITEVTSAGVYQFCNPGGLTIPGGGAAQGAAAPYPSNITVSGLPGTVQTVTVGLFGYTASEQKQVASLLVSPSGANLDFFSQTGGNTAVGPFDVTFTDGASSSVGTLTAGSFKPTSTATDTYPACPANALDCQSTAVGPPAPAGPFTYAGPFGSTTLTTAFGNGSPAGNGEWSLFMETLTEGVPASLTKWCLNFTQNAPALAISIPATGTFAQGGSASFAVTVTNNGPGPAGGTLVPVSVTDTFPSPGITPTGTGAGTDSSWTCPTISGHSITCVNSTLVAASGTFPALVIAGTVDNNSPTGANALQDTASVSGGGAASAARSNTDNITITAAPDLTIAKSHTGPFVQGDTSSANDVYTITVSNLAGKGTTTGSVTVTDSLPAGLTAVSASGTGWVCDLTVSCVTTNSLSAGNNYPAISVTVSIAGNAVSGTNTATVSGGGDLNTANNSASDPTTITPSTTTTASNASATFSFSNQSVTLTATVTSSAGTVNSGTVTFTILNGVTQVGSAVTTGSVSSGTASASYTLPGGTGPGTYTIQAVYNPGAGLNASSDSSHTLTVGQASTTTTGSNQNATFSASAQSVTLSATVTSPAGTVNSGTVTFTVKSGATIIGSPVTSGTVASGNISASFTLPGGTPAGPYTIQAVYNAGIGLMTSMDSTHTLTVSGGNADLTLSAAHSGYFAQGQIGDVLLLTVSNIGAAPTDGSTITVSDMVPSGFTAVSVSGPGWNCSQPAGPCSTTTVLGGSSSLPVITMAVNVGASASTPQVNSATVSGGGDTTPGNDTGIDSIAIVQTSASTLSGLITGKTGATNARVWTITVTNKDSAVAANTQVASLTLTQTSGTACTPVIGTLPVIGSIAASGGTGSGTVTIDFSSCTGTPKFKAVGQFIANGGANGGTMTLYSQGQ